MTHLNRRATVLCTLFSFVILAASAARVTSQIKMREESVAEVSETVQMWHSQIALEVPRYELDNWLATGRADPVPLLRACVIEEAMPVRTE